MFNERIENLKLDMAATHQTRAATLFKSIWKNQSSKTVPSPVNCSAASPAASPAHNNQFDIGSFARLPAFRPRIALGTGRIRLEGQKSLRLERRRNSFGHGSLARILRAKLGGTVERIINANWPTRKRNAANWKPKSASRLSMRPNCNRSPSGRRNWRTPWTSPKIRRQILFRRKKRGRRRKKKRRPSRKPSGNPMLKLTTAKNAAKMRVAVAH